MIRDIGDPSNFLRRHGVSRFLLAAALIAVFISPSRAIAVDQPDPLALNFHLMHPGGDSKPGDPNVAFHLDGTYHLHYILAHDWTVERKTRKGFSFVHVTSPDMLHWTWQPTKLQPSCTGHGMYSGTGLMTKEGKPAVIYHGAGSGRNQIAIAKDRQLSAWEKPFPVEPKTADGEEVEMKHWDPDCFLIGDTYEIRITIDREQAERKRFGFRLFADDNRIGLPVCFQPNNGTLRVGGTEASFAVADLPAGEDVELRIFIDKYLVEVFANGRQAMVAADMDWQTASGFDAYTWGTPTTIRKVEIWKVKPTNQGYLEARKSRVWEPDIE